MEKLETYTWLDLLEKNNKVEPLFHEQGIGLTQLKKLPNYKFLRTNFSKEEMLFFLKDIFHKSRNLWHKLDRQEFAGNVPKILSKYKDLRFRDYDDISVFVPFRSEMGKRNNLKIVHHEFDLERLRSTDSHDRDYGDYGEIFFREYFIDGERAFDYFMTSGNHMQNFNQRWDFLEDSAYGGYYSLRMHLPVEKIMKVFNPVIKKIHREEEISELEKITGKSANQLRKILR